MLAVRFDVDGEAVIGAVWLARGLRLDAVLLDLLLPLETVSLVRAELAADDDPPVMVLTSSHDRLNKRHRLGR